MSCSLDAEIDLDDRLKSVKYQIRIARNELRNIRSKLEELRRMQQSYIQQIRKQEENYVNTLTLSSVGSQTICKPDPDEPVGEWGVKPIGFIQTLFHSKNATPRQPSVCARATAKLVLNKKHFTNPDHAVEGLDQFSHIWILFIFHKNDKTSYTKGKVAPPRLDGKRIGVFATRSPHRPNPVGMSLVALEKVEGTTLYLSGTDHLDGTPVIDIKPYIPDYDKPISGITKRESVDANVPRVPSSERDTDLSVNYHVEDLSVAIPSWISDPPVPKMKVLWTTRALRQLDDICGSSNLMTEDRRNVMDIISSILREDPRSVYRRNNCKDKLYYFTYDVFHVTSWVDENEASFEILRVSKVPGMKT